MVAYSSVDSLVILNPFRTIGLQWSDVKAVELSSKGLGPIMARVELKDGRFIPIRAIQRPNPLLFPKWRIAEGLVEALNRAVASQSRIDTAGL